MAVERPLIDWQNDKEKNDFIERYKAFEFQEVVEPMMILLQGPEGSGKTHLWCTLKELGLPIYVADTEHRARKVAQKKFGLTDIYHAQNWEDLFLWASHICDPKRNLPKGWAVIDSGTDIVTFAERRVLFEDEKKAIGKGYNWTPVYDKVDKFFDLLKNAGHSVVVTARMKDEYINDASTGRQKVSIYNRVPYKADLQIQCNRDGSREMLKPILGPIAKTPITMATTLAELVRLF